MIMDELLEFCDATALNTGAAGTYLIGDQVPLGVTGRDIGNPGSDSMYLVVTCDTTATSGGSATLTLSLASDDSASISTTTSTIHASSKAIPVASITAGAVLWVVCLPSDTAYETYLGILQTTGTAAFTAGKINAFLTRTPARWKAYADATN